MASRQDELLIEFEKFEGNLEVEQVLKKIRTDCGLDDRVTAFGEQLKERERQKEAAERPQDVTPSFEFVLW